MAPVLYPPPDTALARHRQLGPAASVRVSPLCLGTMTFGEKKKNVYGECTKEEAFSILDDFYAQGGNFIDTANGYHFGESEQWLGEWMTSRGNRDDIVLATKYTTGYRLDERHVLQSNYGGNGTKSMKIALEASLKNLQTSYVDIFYLHWFDYTASVEEIMQSLNDLVRAGKVHYLGVSDTPAWIVAKANQYARMANLRPFVVYQGMWNASMRDFERDIIPMCISEGMGIAPYGVLGQGRFQTEKDFEERERENPGRKAMKVSEHDKKVSKALEELSRKKGVNLLDVALAYVRQKAPYVFPIVGGRKLEHIKGSIAALDVWLSDEEMKEVEASYEFDPGFPHTFLSGTMFNEETHRGAAKPADVWLTKALGNFDWVEEPKPIKPRNC